MTGAIAADIHPCVCGHASEQHGHDPEYPGSTSCTECDCIAYEADLAGDDASSKTCLHTIKWKRSTGDFVESHCGQWWITPIYGGLTRPERYDLQRKTGERWRVVGGGQTQRECKEDAARITAQDAVRRGRA